MATGRKITILGMGPSSAERRWDILRYVEGTEIWGLNDGYNMFQHLKGKWSRYFEVHKWGYLKTWADTIPGDYWSSIDALGCPVYVRQPVPVVKNQVRYPGIEVVDHFDSNYFLGSASWMLALALYEHDKGQTVSEIHSYGIDTRDPEHAQQRHSWAYWLRAAQERKIGLGGTAAEFMLEKELDAGLEGWREEIGDELAKRNKGRIGGHLGITHVDRGALEYLKERFDVKTMIDIGCGPGGQVELAKSLGLKAYGIDGDPSVSAAAATHDYRNGPWPIDPVDLAWSCEFLEHVPAEFEPNYMATFKCARVACVTTMNRPGPFHSNPQPEAYWVDLFTRHGFELDAEATAGVREASTMEREFMRNTGLVFVRAEIEEKKGD